MKGKKSKRTINDQVNEAQMNRWVKEGKIIVNELEQAKAEIENLKRTISDKNVVINTRGEELVTVKAQLAAAISREMKAEAELADWQKLFNDSEKRVSDAYAQLAEAQKQCSFLELVNKKRHKEIKKSEVHAAQLEAALRKAKTAFERTLRKEYI